jgi:hypothetical protein
MRIKNRDMGRLFAGRIKLEVGPALLLAVTASMGGVGANAATRANSYVEKANPNTSQVGSLKDAAGATGTLTGKLTLAGKKSSFTWTLTLHHLSGIAAHADIYFSSGKKGTLALPLCVKCQAPAAHGAYIGPYVATPSFVKTIVHGGAYAIVITKQNPKGEIRGQIKANAT